MSDNDPYTLDSRCTCTHRYPHHHGSGRCLRCDCPAFTYTAAPVVRVATAKRGYCYRCGQELLISNPGGPCARCALQLRDSHHSEWTP
jgi:hypothetical protein